MKTKDKNFVIQIKKFIWQYRTKYFVEPITIFSSLLILYLFKSRLEKIIVTKNNKIIRVNQQICLKH